jgi:hypothetical protein
MLRQDDFASGQLVLYGWRHGHEYGGHLASCLIMSVLANRQRTGMGSWMEVIANAEKFHAHESNPIEWPSIWSPEFVRLLHEVQGIFDSTQNYAKDALFWFDSSKLVTNEWFQEKILGNRESHPVVGNMNSIMLLR